MGITDRQREARVRGIGSSDVPRILQLVPPDWGGPWDVWAEKMGLVGEVARRPDELRRMRIGELTEPVHQVLVSEALAKPVVRPTSTYVRGCLRVNVDLQVGRAAKGEPVVECKSTGLLDEWGDPEQGAAGVPARVLAQIMIQMHVAEAAEGYASLLSGRFGFGHALYPVRGLIDQCRELAEFIETWHERHIVRGEEPDRNAAPPAWATLEAMAHTAEKCVTLDPALIDRYRVAHARCDEADAEKDAARRAIAAFLGDAEVGKSTAGSATFKPFRRTALDEGALRAAHPEIVERFTRERVYDRVLRVYPKRTPGARP